MNTLRLFPMELGRLLRDRLTWLTMLLTVLGPVVGLYLYQPAESTMNSLYLANPAIAGGIVGGILYGLLAIFELDRVCRSRADVLMDAAVPPQTVALARLLALLTAAVLTTVLTMLVWFPVSAGMIGAVFDLVDYVMAYLLLMGLALPLGVLAAASAYQFTRRADLSLVLFAAFCALSLTVWAENWQLCWLNPCVWALSDDFSNFRIFRSVAYMRLTWLVGLAGVWAVSYLCIRQYGKGALGSLARSSRRVYRPVIAVILLSCSGVAYAAQPMVDNSNPDQMAMTFFEMPYLDGVICTGRSAQVFPNVSDGTVHGKASYFFENSSGQEQCVAFGVTPGYTISNVWANGEAAPFSMGDYQEFNEALLEVTLPAKTQIELTMEYGGFPRENRNLSGNQGSAEISETYLQLENAALSPRLLNVMPDENYYPAEMEITLPASMLAIPFGSNRAEVEEHENGTKTWRWEDIGTGGILYAGDYIQEDIQAGDMTIELYYGRKHQEIMEQVNAADAVRDVVEYCTAHYGELSFGSGETLKLIQSRIAGGGYAGDGASMLDEADFTIASLRDTSKGTVPGETFIHELVHQWWGLGNMFDTPEPDSPWSAEGLTVYTTYRIVKELYGEEYAQTHYIDQWQQEVDNYYLNFYVRHPEYLEMLPEGERLRISNSLSGMRQYSEMPLKLLKAEKLVGGEETMDQILRDLFNREIDPVHPYLTYDEFLSACALTEEDLNLE
ncbi:MAG: hypothetical protein KHY89_00695 [Butyricicoccus pullicaecorum]|nr:hypothetical protein [Butyricicoccus pullicaecorum]